MSVIQFPESKCRWCLGRIGPDGRYPIPLCGTCFERAKANPTPDFSGGNLWEKMCDEFNVETRAWVKRMKSASQPTRLDVITDSLDAQASLPAIGSQIAAAILARNTGEVDRLTKLLHARKEAIRDYRATQPAQVEALERES